MFHLGILLVFLLFCLDLQIDCFIEEPTSGFKKSGKKYLVPLSYHKHASSYTCVTLRSNIWWKNLKNLSIGNIWLKGKLVDVDISLEFTDDNLVQETLRDLVTNNRIDAFFANVKLQKDGTPLKEDLVKAAKLHTVLKFTTR